MLLTLPLFLLTVMLPVGTHARFQRSQSPQRAGISVFDHNYRVRAVSATCHSPVLPPRPHSSSSLLTVDTPFVLFAALHAVPRRNPPTTLTVSRETHALSLVPLSPHPLVKLHLVVSIHHTRDFHHPPHPNQQICLEFSTSTSMARSTFQNCRENIPARHVHINRIMHKRANQLVVTVFSLRAATMMDWIWTKLWMTAFWLDTGERTARGID